MRKFIVALAAVALLSTAATAQVADDVLKAASQYTFGQEFTALNAIAAAVRDPKADRAALEAQLLGLLDGESTDDCRRFVLKTLWIVAGEKSVPALAKRLEQPDWSHLARYNLERMQAVPAAAAALRDALGRLEGELRLGVIGSLGRAADPGAVEALSHIADGSDAGSDAAQTAAAINALGRIASAEAVSQLLTLAGGEDETRRRLAADAALLAAEQLTARGKKADAAAVYGRLSGHPDAAVALAATRGMVQTDIAAGLKRIEALLRDGDTGRRASAVSLLKVLEGAEAEAALAAMLPRLPAPARVIVIGELAGRGNPAVLPQLLAQVPAQPDVNDDSVQRAAIAAVGVLGDARALPVLLPLAARANDPLREPALEALARLPGDDVNAALQKRLADPGQRTLVIDLLRRRSARSAAPDLARLAAGNGDEAVRLAALQALATLGGDAELPALLAIRKAASGGLVGPATGALHETAARVTDKPAAVKAIVAALADKPDEALHAALLQTLGRIGGAEALAPVQAAMGGEPAIREAALRVLISWPGPEAIDPLLDLAGKTDVVREQVLAIRGVVTQIQQAGWPRYVKARRLQMALEVARRPSEKKLVIAALGQIGGGPSLNVLSRLLDDAEYQKEAALAILAVCQQFRAQKSAPFAAALEKAIPHLPEGQQAAARQLLEQLKP